MVSDFYEGDSLNRLHEVNRSFWNGYLALFDIKESTSRKKEHPERWYAQTETFYRAIYRLGSGLQGLTARPEFSGLTTGDRKVIVKFVGDSGFVFLPLSYAGSQSYDLKAPRDLSMEIVRMATAFQEETHAEHALAGLRLKAVVAYLTGLRPIDYIGEHRVMGQPTTDHGEIPKRDVLGRGIDFAFRLEKFADDSHIVINTMLANSLSSEMAEQRQPPSDGPGYHRVDIAGVTHCLIECQKRVKGWDRPEGERFCLLVCEGFEESRFPSFSPQSENVQAELFTFHLKTARRSGGLTQGSASVDDLLGDDEPGMEDNDG